MNPAGTLIQNIMFLWIGSNYKMKTILTFLVLLFYTIQGYGQSIFHPDFFEIDFYEGYLVKNYPAFPERLNNPILITMRSGITLNGSKFWHKYYHYPDFSFQAGYCNLGNDKVMGGFYFFVPELALSQKAGGNFHVEESLGLGLAYFTKPFNPETNNTNTLTGSRVTFMPTGSLGLGYSFSRNFSVFARINIHHASNSHFQLPNLGANVLSAGIGVRYKPGEVSLIKNNDAYPTDKRFHFNLRAALGINQRGGTTDYVGDKHYRIYLLQFYLSRNYSEITRYQFGFEAYYNTGLYDTIRSSNFYSSQKNIKASSFLFILGHEFLVGHFSLCTQGGVFIFNPYHRDIQKIKNETNNITKMESLFLARIGINYYFKNAIITTRNQLFAGVFIKTNCGKADFLESTIGFMF